MKTHTVIIDSNGERKVTSTTETLRIPASEIRPGDWLLKPHRRGLAKDKLVKNIKTNGPTTYLTYELWGANVMFSNQLVDVERTT